MSRKGINIILSLLMVVVVAVIFVMLILYGKAGKREKVIIGFISTGWEQEQGWNRIHIEAAKAVCKELGAKLILKENIKEFSGECVPAAKELISSGASLLILSSYNYMEELSDTIEENPGVFYYVNHTRELDQKNVTTYLVRLYQARYLSGILAGMKTKTGRIGYVAAMDNCEVNRGINAFTLGVRSVNPDAEVWVAWTGNWDNEAREKAAVHRLAAEEQIDVVTYHQNQPYTLDAAEEENIFSIGYHQAFEGYSDKCLTSVTGDWKLVYSYILKQYMQGKANHSPYYWIGLEKDAVLLSEYSDEVTEEMRQAVEEAVLRIKSGKDVFSGEIFDTEGNLRCGENEIISDRVLLEELDWFVEGVRFLPEE